MRSLSRRSWPGTLPRYVDPVPLLRIPEPYDFALSTERYRAFGPDLANLWHQGGLYRAVRGREVAITAAPGGADVVPLNVAIGADVRTLLGTMFDLAGFEQFAESDSVLARLVPALRGFRPPINPDPFETLVTSITAQQVSLRSASAVRNRLIEAFGRQLRIAWEFPRTERLASARESDLTALGFSQRKAEYVLGIAREELGWAELHALADEEVKARLVRIRGVGEWTADWFLARHLARQHAWPAGDLGLVKAVALFYFDGAPPTTNEMRAFGDRFAPFENLAAHYLLTGSRIVPAS
jgi:3-methyladenine DNA glycosylase/8-oxoguanine DNA glycosylase